MSGDIVGTIDVGFGVGNCVTLVGLRVSRPVGFEVGLEVGLLVGAKVGLAVGDTVISSTRSLVVGEGASNNGRTAAQSDVTKNSVDSELTNCPPRENSLPARERE